MLAAVALLLGRVAAVDLPGAAVVDLADAALSPFADRWSTLVPPPLKEQQQAVAVEAPCNATAGSCATVAPNASASRTPINLHSERDELLQHWTLRPRLENVSALSHAHALNAGIQWTWRDLVPYGDGSGYEDDDDSLEARLARMLSQDLGLNGGALCDQERRTIEGRLLPGKPTTPSVAFCVVLSIRACRR